MDSAFDRAAVYLVGHVGWSLGKFSAKKMRNELTWLVENNIRDTAFWRVCGLDVEIENGILKVGRRKFKLTDADNALIMQWRLEA